MLIELPVGATVAGVFTQNAFCAAPVTVCKQHLLSHPRYLLVNSGNANACTGDQGMSDALQSCASMATVAGAIVAQQVLPFSTGVIGEPLPTQKITDALPELFTGLHEAHWSLAAKGIMTTDTRAKGATQSFEYQGETIVVNGISKGAGMINPNMATMLGFIATNANVSQELLNTLSFNAANQSFNRITIDGDTSTNDSCMLMASGASSLHVSSSSDPLYRLLETAVFDVYRSLAQAIVKDGEGATKFVTVCIEKGRTANECLQVAYAIAHSPLVKTALFASDPNWGRIVAAIGYADVDSLDASQVLVYLNDVLIVENGGRASSYTEAAGQAVMDQSEIVLRVILNRGDALETIWTTDLSHEYVTINAEYRT
jgi:glutamate N-acetyltransferase/amino-acid N-acetyltransferase